MDSEHRCSTCGKALEANAPGGLCPECLIKVGLGSGVDIGPETEAGAARPAFVPPSVAELAGKFPQLEILELIGKGGMGAVYKARQRELDRIVALKILPPGIGQDAAFADRFTREARALAKLNHPGIVTLYEFGRTDGLYFFLMEYVDGVNLRQLLAGGRVSAREALAIVPQICDALQYAHDQGIVHRDIKPENILLDRRGRVKVADFGLAKIIGGEAGGADLPVSPEIEAAQQHGPTGVMGTPHYMSPEQISAPGEVDHRADIYALGVVFYQMLTGELPGRQIEPPSKKVQIDVRLDEVVLRALEAKPELRYQQASVLKTQIETIASTPDSGTRQFADAESGKSEIRNPKSEIESRFSRTAIVGACWAPFFLMALGLMFGVKPHVSVPAETQPSGPGLIGLVIGWLLVLLGATAPFGTTILGWVAVTQIRHSAGKLYGLWLAVFDGLLFPLLAMDGLVFLGYARVVRDLERLPDLGAGRLIVFGLGLLSVALVVWLDIFIIRSVWRAVNGTNPNSAAPAPPVQKPGRFRRRLVLSLILVPMGLFILAWAGYRVCYASANSSPLLDVHYRVFEVDRAFADQLAPVDHRQVGATGNWQMVQVTPETLAALLEGRVLNKHVMIERYCKVPNHSAGKTYVTTHKPGVEKPVQEVIVGWPVVADNWAHTLEDQVANDIAVVSGTGYFGVRRKGGGLELKTEYTLTHRIGGRPAVDVNIAFEGSAPQTGAVAFFIPFARNDDSTGYYVMSVGVQEKADIESVVVSMDKAVVKQRSFHGEGMIIMLGDMTNRWMPSHLDSLFDITLQGHSLGDGADWVVKSAHGIYANYRLDGPPGPMLGKVVFSPGTPTPEADGSYVIGTFRPEGGNPLPITVKLEIDKPAQPPGTGATVRSVRSPFPQGAHLGGAANNVLVCHDDVDVIHALFYNGEFGSSTHLEHNTKTQSWQEDGSIKLTKSGRAFGYLRLQSDPETLHINGQEFDLRRGRVLVLHDDGTIEQLKMFPPLAVAMSLDKLAPLVAATGDCNTEPVTVEKLRLQLENAQAQFNDVLKTCAPTHPLVAEVRQAIETLKKKIADAEGQAAHTTRSGLLTIEEAARQREALARLDSALAAETTEAGKFTQYLKAMREDPDVDVREHVLDLAIKQSTGPELEALLLKRLDEEPDGGLRSRCAAMLGQYGSEKCLTRLVRTAATDQETTWMVGDIHGRRSARRDAVFALAELGRRLPQASGSAIKALRELSTTNAPPGESLEDVRVQALYQLTFDDSLLAPFRARLQSNDEKQRVSGVVAFRFLKLHQAPPELRKTLNDPAPEVRSWAALVLGEIGDPQTVPQLMAAAGNRSLDAGTRCNAIDGLGRMRAAAASALMEKLLDDPEPAVPGNAAVALYRITGKKVKQFPEGYNAD